MEKLTRIMRQALGKEGLLYSTSAFNAPIEHGLLHGVLRELHCELCYRDLYEQRPSR